MGFPASVVSPLPRLRRGQRPCIPLGDADDNAAQAICPQAPVTFRNRDSPARGGRCGLAYHSSTRRWRRSHTTPPAVPSEGETLIRQARAGAAPGCPTVPGYEILRELGRGGMGVVYQARHRKLNRLVALKMILAGSHAGAADLARFQTEAEAIARLQHPNIVQVYEVGEHEGQPFFSLEFCGGGSLEKKLDGTPLPPREAAALVETLARAMQAAHEQHVIHRDLKPANVLLADDGTPKIMPITRSAHRRQVARAGGVGDPLRRHPAEDLGWQPELGKCRERSRC